MENFSEKGVVKHLSLCYTFSIEQVRAHTHKELHVMAQLFGIEGLIDERGTEECNVDLYRWVRIRAI